MSARVAYLITSYTLPRQTLRLASVLRGASPEAAILMHHDRRRCAVDRVRLEALGVELVEPPSAVEWGEFSQLEMVLRCIRHLLRTSDFAWLVLLSGQDYPVRPVAEIEQWLSDADVDALIETTRCDPPGFRGEIDEFAARYHFRWRPLPAKLANPAARVAAKAGPVVQSRVMAGGPWIGLRALRSPFGPRLICHRGLDWFTLSRGAVEAVDSFVDRRPEVLDFYRRTVIPTESFVHTVVANDPRLRLSSDHRRWVSFDDERRPRPSVLRVGDLESILASGAHFARKFDETVDRAVLDEIDRRVHGASFASSAG
jgi:Core-2/I-Branching enzyme